MDRISDRIRGRLSVEAFGAFPETLLNAASFDAVELWNIESVNDNTLRFDIYESSYKQIKKLADDCTCDIKITERVGGSKDRRFVRRRGILFISAIAAA